MFNRQQRDELNSLSEKIWGATFRWKKLLDRKDPNFQIPVENVTENTGRNYVHVGRKGRTIMRVEVARAKGLLDHDQEIPDTVREKTIFRDPNFDELKWMLERLWEEEVISEIAKNNNSLMVLFVWKFFNKDLKYPLLIRKSTDSEQYNKWCEGHLANIHEDLATDLKDVILEADTPVKRPGDFFDAEEFLNELAYLCKAEPEWKNKYGAKVDQLIKDAEESILNDRKIS